MARERKPAAAETAESMAQKQREISVSEFFLKNRHLLGFDSPRKALLTAVKEAVDNSLDACEEGGILPEIGVEIVQVADDRFKVSVTDNGPGIVKAQIPRIFAKLLYGSKFHRLRMSRGQQGIGISAAGMYGQLTTGTSTRILSKVKGSKKAHHMEVQIDTRANKPAILTDEEAEWLPVFTPVDAEGRSGRAIEYKHGTCVEIVMEAAYVRGRLSVDEYLKQCAIVNPHLQLHYRLALLKKDAKPVAGFVEAGQKSGAPGSATPATGSPPATEAFTYARAVNKLPVPPTEIKPHPHGVELGLLMQMLKGTAARTLRSALTTDFSRVGDRSALEICGRAGLNPKANPTRIAHQESEALYKAIQDTKLMRPPTDCLSPIGEAQILAGLKKEIAADFYTAVTRDPEVYRGNPFQVEVGLAYAKPDPKQEIGADEPVRVMRFANRVPLLYQAGACGMTEAVGDVNWKTYGLAQPKGGLPVGPMVILLHMASVWVPFTSESKEAVAHYPEILKEFTYALQECGRQLSVYLSRRRRQAEVERKRSYIELYIPHLALGLREILAFDERKEKQVIQKLGKMLEKTHLDV
ncbi:MAG: DNA topoisomerase VI subunit B [Kiritimatiellae bacterium]|nr:DNA topoisomerase VI subunit B [Kiritimatiellia bacterium]